MCNKPWLLCVDYEDGALPLVEFFDGEGPAEEAGKSYLNTHPNAVRFSVYCVVSEFARVTEIKRVSLKPSLSDGDR